MWLDAAKTSPYDFYQFFFRVEIATSGAILRYFTFLDEPTIVALDEQSTAPEKREAQRTLAREVTRLVHGAGGGAIRRRRRCRRRRWRCRSRSSTCSSSCGLCKSKCDARRQIEQGGVYVDGARIDDVNYVLDEGADASARQARQAADHGAVETSCARRYGRA